MGFELFLFIILTHRKLRHERRQKDLIIILNRYSWFLIIFTVANYSCFVTTTNTTLENKAKFLEVTTTTSSTVRPWPSHEFIQNVINERPTQPPSPVNVSSWTNNGTLSNNSNTSINQSLLLSSSSPPPPTIPTILIPQSERENKQLNATFDISSLNKKQPGNDSPPPSIEKVKILKEISMDFPSTTLLNSTTKINEKNWTQEKINENSFSTTPNPDDKLNLSPRNKGIKSDVEEKKEEEEKTPSVESQLEIKDQLQSLPKSPITPTPRHDNSTGNPKDGRKSKEIFPRRWISIISSSNTTTSPSTTREDVESGKRLRDSTLLHPIVQTTGELPFRVKPLQGKRTELSEEFYAKLQGHTVTPYETDGLSPPPPPPHPHPDMDYVNDDKLNWWTVEEQDKYSMSTVRPPNFTRLTWPYKDTSPSSSQTTQFSRPRPNLMKSEKFQGGLKKQEQQQQHHLIPLPTITTNPALNSLKSTLKTTRKTTTRRPTILMTSVAAAPTSYSTSVFPILFTSVQSIPTTPSPFHSSKNKNKISTVHHWGSSGSQQIVNHSNLFPLGRVNVTGASSSVSGSGSGIKLSTDVITSTSTDSSVMAQLSQVLLSPPLPGNKEHNHNFVEGGGFRDPGLRYPTTKAPTNIWYKPVINHHYSSTGSGSSPVTSPVSGPGMTTTPNPFFSLSLPSGHGHEEKKDENIDRYGEEDEDTVLFKLWNVSNGTLQLNNEKQIPSWILKDYEIENDQVLNLNELPMTVQKMVQQRFLTVSGKSEPMDGHWIELPVVEPERGGKEHEDRRHPGMPSSSSSSYINYGKRRKPVSLNYVLWNDDDDPPPPKTPHDFLMYDQGGGGQPSMQMQNYLQHFLQKPNPYFQGSAPTDWIKLDSYLKDQAAAAGGHLPYSSLLDFNQPPSQYPWHQKFEDKDISNLVAVSLILSYLNKNKQDHFPGSFLMTTHGTSATPLPDHLHTLMSYQYNTPPPPGEKEPNWDAINPVLKHTKPFTNPENKFPSIPSTAPSLRPPSYLFDTMTTGPEDSNVDRFRLEESDLFIPVEQQTLSPQKGSPSKTSVTLERGETSELGNQETGDLTKTMLLKKKLQKKHRKKFKKKKGNNNSDNFGLNFDVGVDLADLFKKKFLALLTLQYAPIVLLLLMVMGPTLMIWSPYIMQSMRTRFGITSSITGGGGGPGPGGLYEDRDEFHTYIYPYNYAYPVVPQNVGVGGLPSASNNFDQFDYDPYDEGGQQGAIQAQGTFGRGRGRNVRSRKKGNVEIHHHFHDIPITSSNIGVQQSPLTLSSTFPVVTSIVTGGSTPPQIQYGNTYGNPIVDPGHDYGSYVVPTNQGYQGKPEEHQEVYQDPMLSSSSNDADSYMKRIREIGRNLGILIGSQISENVGKISNGESQAMQTILQSKKDALNQLLENWSMSSGALRSQYRTSEEDDFYRKKLPLMRKRKS